jgi:hypothetical protein
MGPTYSVVKSSWLTFIIGVYKLDLETYFTSKDNSDVESHLMAMSYSESLIF